MKRVLGTILATGIILGMAAPTFAAENLTLSFDPAGVAFAYNDGYWDRDHQWHKWKDEREAREYREKYPDKAVICSGNGLDPFGWAQLFGVKVVEAS